MIKDPERLRGLIEKYGRMHRLEGYTPHSRGQCFNKLIAELLICWNLDATSNLRSCGEIDVAFELGGRHFIVEAKWESTRTNTGALAKLQKRLRQRLGGTIGVFVSMAGYTDEALEDLKEGEQLMVLCLTCKHFEAMLSGFIPPEELISKLVTKASRQGLGFVELENLFDPPYISEMIPVFGHPTEIEELVVDATPGFDARTEISALPFGQSGVAELAPDRLLLTTTEGIFLADLTRKTVTLWLSIPNCSRNPLVQPNGSVYVVRESGVGCIKQGKLEIVAGGLIGNVCLSLGSNNSIWAFSNGYPLGERGDIPPLAVRLGEQLGTQTSWTVDYPAAEAHVAGCVEDNILLVCGVGGIALVSPNGKDELISRRENPLTNPGGLTRLSEDRFLIASNSVELWEINISTYEISRIAELRLNGSIYELAPSSKGGGFLWCHYTNHEAQTRGIVVRWNYTTE